MKQCHFNTLCLPVCVFRLRKITRSNALTRTSEVHFAAVSLLSPKSSRAAPSKGFLCAHVTDDVIDARLACLLYSYDVVVRRENVWVFFFSSTAFPLRLDDNTQLHLSHGKSFNSRFFLGSYLKAQHVIFVHCTML